MRVVVSNKLKVKYRGYRVFKSFEELEKSGESVECIVLHSTLESDFSIGLHLSKLKKQGVKVFAYINESPSVTITMCILGCGGTVEQDEFYFDDEGDLDYLLSTLGLDSPHSVSSVALSSVGVISDFIQYFINGDERLNTEFYLSSVQRAVSELAEQTKTKDLVIKDMSNSAVGIFNQASQVLEGMQKSRKELESKFNELEGAFKQREAPRMSKAAVTMYPAFNYRGQAKMLHIQELTPCRYLTTFILSYQYYLSVSLNKRVKVIFIHQKASRVSEKYRGFTTTINSDNLSNENLISSDTVATDSPKLDVMTKLTSCNDDVIIVVDRLYNEPIVRGTAKTVYAVSGLSDMTRYKVKPSECIFPVSEHPNALMCLPIVKSFPVDANTRQATCYQLYKPEHYAKLDKILGIGGK